MWAKVEANWTLLLSLVQSLPGHHPEFLFCLIQVLFFSAPGGGEGSEKDGDGVPVAAVIVLAVLLGIFLIVIIVLTVVLIKSRNKAQPTTGAHVVQNNFAR